LSNPSKIPVDAGPDWVDKHVGSSTTFVRALTLSTADAQTATLETFERAAAGKAPAAEGECDLWLLKIAAYVIEKKLPPTPEVDFDLLDETLRSDATRTHEVSSLSAPSASSCCGSSSRGA